MRLSVRALYWLSPLVFVAALGCNESCDELCMEDYRDCEADNSSESCDAERQRCIATCGSEAPNARDDN